MTKLTKHAAMVALLAVPGLSFAQALSGTVIASDTGKPLPGAVVLAVGVTSSPSQPPITYQTKTDGNGNFTLSTTAGQYRLCASGGSYLNPCLWGGARTATPGAAAVTLQLQKGALFIARVHTSTQTLGQTEAVHGSAIAAQITGGSVRQIPPTSALRERQCARLWRCAAAQSGNDPSANQPTVLNGLRRCAGRRAGRSARDYGRRFRSRGFLRREIRRRPHNTSRKDPALLRESLIRPREASATLDEITAGQEVYPQRLVNIRVREKVALDEVPSIAREIRHAEEEFAGAGRVLVRYSGTEPLARVMVEGPDLAQVESATARIAEAIRRELGS